MQLSLADVTAWTTEVFARHGCSADNARAVAQALVTAEADGLKGHGLSRIPTYLTLLKSGKVDGQATPAATRTAPAVLAIDAADGFAYPAIDLALRELPPLAQSQGVATAAIHRSSHCGAAGWHVERLANAGLVALMVANTPAAMAPWGGRVPVFGTNPIAFAAPRDGAPLVVDLSVSKVARGNLVAAKQRGEAIPEGWALDADGAPTTDPAAGLKGTMVPLGDAKGAALAAIVEVLAVCLAGAALSADASSFLDGEGGPSGTGQLIVAFDPRAFGHDRYGALMTALAASITAQDGARLPGARRFALRAAAARDGLVIPAEVLAAAGQAA
ncbi:MAG: Ldh family oxidoreductase [Pseudomonadota bacterium]|jgi:(2R)-3-sulfolactate dehydrogenase (NADP+)